MNRLIRVARTTELTSINPLLYNDQGTGEFLNRLFGHLIVTDSRGRYVDGSVVESRHRQPDRKGLVSYLFRLRAGRWHDGTPISARDVEFTLRAVLDQDLASPRRPEVLAAGEDLVAVPVSEREVLVEFGGRGVGLPALAWLPMLPRHHYGRAGQLRSRRVRPVGSGEFRFGSGEPGGALATMSANPAHWRPPHLDGVEWRRFGTAREALDSVLAGESDIATAVPPALLPAAASAPDVSVQVSDDSTAAYLACNLDAPLLRDRQLRAALASALDRRELVDRVLGGHGRVAAGLIHPLSPWHRPGGAAEAADPEAAAAALDRLGWRTDRTGVRCGPSGRRLTLTLHTVAGDEVKSGAARLVAEQLARVGIQVELRLVSMADLLNDHIYPRRYDLALLALKSGPTPSFLRAFYHSAGNRFGYRSPVVDQLIDALPSTWDETDPDAVELVHEIQRHVARDVPHVPLFHPRVVNVVSTRIALPPADGLFANRFSDLHAWRVSERAAR